VSRSGTPLLPFVVLCEAGRDAASACARAGGFHGENVRLWDGRGWAILVAFHSVQGFVMAKKKARPARNPWSVADLKKLKSMAGKSPTAMIAASLGRTPGSIQQKAMSEGLSLALKKRKK
jgi:hypothetical protein